MNRVSTTDRDKRLFSSLDRPASYSAGTGDSFSREETGWAVKLYLLSSTYLYVAILKYKNKFTDNRAFRPVNYTAYFTVTDHMDCVCRWNTVKN